MNKDFVQDAVTASVVGKIRKTPGMPQQSFAFKAKRSGKLFFGKRRRSSAAVLLTNGWRRRAASRRLICREYSTEARVNLAPISCTSHAHFSVFQPTSGTTSFFSESLSNVTYRFEELSFRRLLPRLEPNIDALKAILKLSESLQRQI
jgi:hypothetical protein